MPKAIRFTQNGGPEVLQWEAVEPPPPAKPGEPPPTLFDYLPGDSVVALALSKAGS